LWGLAGEISELEAPGTWGGGDVIDHTDDGHDVYEMPYIIYAEPVAHYIQLWDEMGLVVPYGRVFLDRPDALQQFGWLDSVPISEVVRFGSAIIRLERFSDGLFGEAVESGAIDAIIEKLREWKEGHPAGGESTELDRFAAWLRTYRDRCQWRAAKSGPPHDYTVRNWRPEANWDFKKAVIGIREFGQPQLFYESSFIYFELDGSRYWTMGDSLLQTRVINRDLVENRYE
jgi:Family of unknown function (DUF6508)